MTPSEFAEVRAFLLVADERSFRRAAKRLGVSPSALSRTIRSLEERLNARLLDRTTRSVAPTEAGQTLYDRVVPTMQEMAAAMRDVGGRASSPPGTVRVNLPTVAADLMIGPNNARQTVSLDAFSRGKVSRLLHHAMGHDPLCLAWRARLPHCLQTPSTSPLDLRTLI